MILFLYILYPAIICFFYRVVFGPMTRITFHHIFLVTYIVFIYIRGYEVYSEDQELRLGYMLALIMVPTLYLIGAAFVSLLLKPRSHKVASLERPVLSGVDRYVFSLVPFASFVFIPLPIIYLADVGVSNLPLFYAVQNPGDFMGAMELRIDSLKSNISPLLTYFYGYSRATFYLIYCNLLLASYMFKKIGLAHFVVGLLCAVFFCISATAKAPLAYLIASLSITYIHIAGVRIVSLKVVMVFMCALLLPGAFYALLSGGEQDSQLVYVLENVWRRVTWVPTYIASLYFDLFGNYFDYSGISSNSLTAAIFGADYRPSASLMYDYFAPKGLEGGLLNAAFFASFYADWGWAGVVFGSIFVGIIIASVQLFYDKFGNCYSGVCFKSVSLIAMSQIQLTNFYSLLVGKGLLLSLVIYIALLSLYGLKKERA